MLSSDKNVETIAQLAEIVKHYLGIQAEYFKLDVVEKGVRLLTFFALAIVLFLIMVGVVLFLSLALAFWLGSYTGTATAFLVVGALHLLIVLVFLLKRKTWIERPLVRFFANMFLNT